MVRQKVDLRRTFYFETRIHPEVRGFINLFSICACSTVRFGTVRLEWKAGLNSASFSRVQQAVAAQYRETTVGTLSVRKCRHGGKGGVRSLRKIVYFA